MAKKRKQKPKPADNPINEKCYHDTSIDHDFENGLDHIAYHLAERLQDATNGWQQQIFINLLAKNVPAQARHLMSDDAAWQQLADYIFKWVVWQIERDTNGIALYTGRVKVSVVHKSNARRRVLGITFGYELQSTLLGN